MGYEGRVSAACQSTARGSVAEIWIDHRMPIEHDDQGSRVFFSSTGRTLEGAGKL